MMKKSVIALLFLAYGGLGASVDAAVARNSEAENSGPKNSGEIQFYTYRIVNAFPHDKNLFTQGLFIHGGALYESSGQYGGSQLRKSVLNTGQVVLSLPLSDKVFGEGSTIFGSKVFVLTWRSGAGLVVDSDTFKPERTFTYDGEGWGLTHNGKRLIMSDGTPELRFLDPETLKETSRLKVTYKGAPVQNINELEFIKGEIFANLWQSDVIVRINPDNGAVTGVIDLQGLLPEKHRIAGQTNVLNGIAYDHDTDRLFVTGKYWPKLFEIELTVKQ